MEPRTKTAIADLDQRRRELRAAIDEARPALRALRPEADRWSVDLIVEHLASIGRITPQQFADRLRFLETFARGSTAYGRVAFADRSVDWRVPDAEQIAYKGGAMLAFHMDVELRGHGAPGLPMLLRDLMRENGGKYTLGALQKWCEENGLKEVWQKHVVAAALPDVGDGLVRLGYRETREGDARVIKVAGDNVQAFFKFEPAKK